MTSSIPPTYEQQQFEAVQLAELECQSRAAAPSAATAQPPVPPPPPVNHGTCHPVNYLFDPPAHLQGRGLGGTIVGVFGRTHEETLRIVRRAFPGALGAVPDIRIVLSIPAETEDPRARTPKHWVRLSAGWWQAQAAPPPPANLASGLLGHIIAPQAQRRWPTLVKVDLELTALEAQYLSIRQKIAVIALVIVVASVFLAVAFASERSMREAAGA